MCSQLFFVFNLCSVKTKKCIVYLLRHPCLLLHRERLQWTCVVWSLDSVALADALATNGTSWPPLGAFDIPNLQKTSYCFPSQQEATTYIIA